MHMGKDMIAAIIRESREDLRRRLHYQATRRGMKEIDLLLSVFAEAYLPIFDDTQLAEFDKLLQLQDRDILNWHLRRTLPPAECNSSVMQLLLIIDIPSI